MTAVVSAVFGVTLVVLVLNSDLIIRLRKLLRTRRLAEAKASLAKCAADIQKFMGDGTVKDGEFVHDFFFAIVNEAQYMDRFMDLSVFLQRPSERQHLRAIEGALNAEMSKLPREIKLISRRFQEAYFQAAAARHPFQLFLMVAFTISKIVLREIRVRATVLRGGIWRGVATAFGGRGRALSPRLALLAISLGILLIQPTERPRKELSLLARSSH